jgi:hypothetical protein
MAQFTLEIADTDVERVTAALSQAGGFIDPTVENALSTVMTFIQQTVTNVETANARAVALAAVKPVAPVVLTPGITPPGTPAVNGTA